MVAPGGVLMSYEEEYEDEFEMEHAGYLEDEEEQDSFEKQYEQLFEEESENFEEDIELFERDPVTGRKAKKNRLSVLNQTQLSKQEMDEIFLE